jgi:hypothetical protein
MRPELAMILASMQPEQAASLRQFALRGLVAEGARPPSAEPSNADACLVLETAQRHGLGLHAPSEVVPGVHVFAHVITGPALVYGAFVASPDGRVATRVPVALAPMHAHDGPLRRQSRAHIAEFYARRAGYGATVCGPIAFVVHDPAGTVFREGTMLADSQAWSNAWVDAYAAVRKQGPAPLLHEDRLHRHDHVEARIRHRHLAHAVLVAGGATGLLPCDAFTMEPFTAIASGLARHCGAASADLVDYVARHVGEDPGAFAAAVAAGRIDADRLALRIDAASLKQEIEGERAMAARAPQTIADRRRRTIALG